MSKTWVPFALTITFSLFIWLNAYRKPIPTDQIAWNFYLEVAKGNVPGHYAVNKFGENSAVATGPEDVWAGGGLYDFYPTTAQSMVVFSSSALDDVAGDGARTAIFYGLDANWDRINETIDMDGTTEVVLTNTYIRMYRGIVLTVGDSSSNVGNITCRTVSDSTVAVYVTGEEGQTQQSPYTIPDDYYGFFVKGYVGVSDGGNAASRESARLKWRARPNNGFKGAWQTKGEIECINDGSSWWQYRYGVPAGMLPPKTDIRIECSETSTVLGVVCGYDMIVIHKNYLTLD